MALSHIPVDLTKTPRENLFMMIKEANKNEPWIDALTEDSFVVLDVIPLADPYDYTTDDGEIVEINSALRIRGQGLWRGVQTIEYSRIRLEDLQTPELVGDENIGSYITATNIANALGIATTGVDVSTATLMSTHTSVGFNDFDGQHIKTYLKLHQSLITPSTGAVISGKITININAPEVLFDGSTQVTSLAMYTGSVDFALARP